jgi:ribosome biogenesis GTPase / thiamine phosphate phosphatase
MKLEDFGYNAEIEKFRNELKLYDYDIGRVIEEHKERYVVKTIKGEFEAEITGNIRFTAKNREDFPAVGDWVAMTIYDSAFALIYKILPRSSIIKRQAVDKSGEIQIIATNIDVAFIVQSADRDFNINRLERYLTICNNSKIDPVIILSKVDLIDESRINEIIENIKVRIKNVPVFPMSNESLCGLEAIKSLIEKGRTYCLLGSSGVGKSSLLNNLAGKKMMKTDTISQSTNKGKHVTSHRELIILENGGILIDNPGIREVGVADATNGLEITFDIISQLSQSCKFKDCTHNHEAGCAVRKAVEDGKINAAAYENYLKLEKEKTYFESSVIERRNKNKKFGKMVKNYKNEIKKEKY